MLVLKVHGRRVEKIFADGDQFQYKYLYFTDLIFENITRFLRPRAQGAVRGSTALPPSLYATAGPSYTFLKKYMYTNMKIERLPQVYKGCGWKSQRIVTKGREGK